MSDDRHELTDDDLLRLYMSGIVTGGTNVAVALEGVTEEEALHAVVPMARRLIDDPAIRETVLDLHRAGGGRVLMRTVPATEGDTP